MKIEPGKRYRRRDGKVTGSIMKAKFGECRFYDFYDPDSGIAYSEKGEYWTGLEKHDKDLVSEYLPDDEGE